MRVLSISGNAKECEQQIRFHIAQFLVARSFCSWTPHILYIDVWNMFSAQSSLERDVSCCSHVFASSDVDNKLLSHASNTRGAHVRTFYHCDLQLQCSPEDLACGVCGRLIPPPVGKSKQIYCCSGGHIGISRHPGSDDVLNWEHARCLARRFLFGTPSGEGASRSAEVWNEIEVCLSEASACRASDDAESFKSLELQWRILLCADVLSFERDCLLLLSVSCWKCYVDGMRESENTAN